MQWFHLMMLGAFALTLFVVRKSPRHLLWAGVLTGSYLIAEAYLFMPKPTSFDLPWDGNVYVGMWGPQSLFNAALDSVICLGILTLARQRWEVGVFVVTMTALALGLLQATHAMSGSVALPDRIYGIILEVLNYAALLFISGHFFLERINDTRSDYRRLHGGLARRLVGRILSVCVVLRRILQAPWEPSRRWKA